MTCTFDGSADAAANVSFSISFRQGTTDLLFGNSSLLDLEEALQSLHTIGDVEVLQISCMRYYFRRSS